MVEALKKSNKVAEALKNLASEAEFWQWYDKEIKQESQLADDRLTFGEAIKKVEDDFWDRPSRTKRKRDKDNPSDQSSWHDTYGRFYKYLPTHKTLNLADIQKVIDRQKKGTKTFKGVVSSMKRLCRLAHNRALIDQLDEIDVMQVEYKKLQNITLQSFLEWKDRVLGVSSKLRSNARIDVRKAWLWVFSTQIIYGLRIHEVFAISNLYTPFETEDGVIIPSLSDATNTNNLIVVSGFTATKTTTKTGYRIARPNIPPAYPNLIDLLDIKNPLLPEIGVQNGSDRAKANYYNKSAYKKLLKWNAPFTQTHALRHLANINGIQAGIPQEVRAQSMGHTVQMNESVYKKRQSTQTTIDLLLNSNQNAIDFVTALASVKRLCAASPEDKEISAKILSIVYQKDKEGILALL